jgi:hypothetical protein
VAATSGAARALAERLLRLADADLEALRGVAGARLLLIAGPAERLPWADGVEYLGRDAAASSLLLPTCHEPLVPLDLLQRALLHRLTAAATPVAVLLRPPLLVPAGSARPVERQALRSWLASQR